MSQVLRDCPACHKPLNKYIDGYVKQILICPYCGSEIKQTVEPKFEETIIKNNSKTKL